MKRPGKAMKIKVDTDHEPDLFKISEMFPLPEEEMEAAEVATPVASPETAINGQQSHLQTGTREPSVAYPFPVSAPSAGVANYEQQAAAQPQDPLGKLGPTQNLGLHSNNPAPPQALVPAFAPAPSPLSLAFSVPTASNQQPQPQLSEQLAMQLLIAVLAGGGGQLQPSHPQAPPPAPLSVPVPAPLHSLSVGQAPSGVNQIQDGNTAGDITATLSALLNQHPHTNPTDATHHTLHALAATFGHSSATMTTFGSR